MRNDFELLASKVLSDPQTWKPLAEVIFDMIDKKKHVDVSEISKLGK